MSKKALMESTTTCQICGRLARGLSYGVVACISCRSFYRRCMKKPVNLRHKCQGDDNCVIQGSETGKRFSRCKSCRFRKYCTLQLRWHPQLRATAKTKNSVLDREIAEIESTLQLTGTTKKLRWEVDSAGQMNQPTINPVEQSTKSRIPVGDVEDHVTNLSGRCVLAETTMQGVHNAIQTVFGDQISEWTKCLTSALRDGHVASQPQADTDEIILALRDHYADNLKRTLKFFEMLPGTEKFDTPKNYNIASWKALVSYLIHHAPFATSNETYFTIGEKQLHYYRHWQKNERVTNWAFQVFFYKFCTELRDIGLEEIERYLLIVIVLLEPENDTRDAELGIIHRHYTDTLLHVIRQRSFSHSEYMVISRKLVDFFDKIKVVQPLMDWFFYSG